MIGIMIAMASAFGQESVLARNEMLIQELMVQEARAEAVRCQAINRFIDIFGSSTQYLQDLRDARQDLEEKRQALRHRERRLIHLQQAPESPRRSAALARLKGKLTRAERQRLLNYYRASSYEDWLVALSDMYHELLRRITYQEFGLLAPSAVRRHNPFDHRNPVRCPTNEPSNAYN